LDYPKNPFEADENNREKKGYADKAVSEFSQIPLSAVRVIETSHRYPSELTRPRGGSMRIDNTIDRFDYSVLRV
jgi:hypothetical protein